MKIKSLHIKNFKSIVDLTITEPNPFTVFVGSNGSGKSNIFEALGFCRTTSLFRTSFNKKGDSIISSEVINMYGGKKAVLNYNSSELPLIVEIIADKDNKFELVMGETVSIKSDIYPDTYLYPFFSVFGNFSRIFIGKNIDKIRNNGDLRLNNLLESESNIEKVLKRIFSEEIIKDEIIEWLELLIPEFKNIEIIKSEFSNDENLLIYFRNYQEPFNKSLISDGTYNIIALLTAVYQSDEPQFLCIEEPENGLHPQVQKQLVEFFRQACEEKGHYIWLNTHSQSIVQVLTKEEIILVDKKQGETTIKQVKDMDDFKMKMDDAWLTNFLGGGLPW